MLTVISGTCRKTLTVFFILLIIFLVFTFPKRRWNVPDLNLTRNLFNMRNTELLLLKPLMAWISEMLYPFLYISTIILARSSALVIFHFWKLLYLAAVVRYAMMRYVVLAHSSGNEPNISITSDTLCQETIYFRIYLVMHWNDSHYLDFCRVQSVKRVLSNLLRHCWILLPQVHRLFPDSTGAVSIGA